MSIQIVKVCGVVDGDGVYVQDEKGNAFEVRLSFIDSPERDQPGGPGAQFALTGLVHGRYVYLKKHGKDHYGRTLGEVFLVHNHGVINVNHRMIALGHAWVYRHFCEDLPTSKKIEIFFLERHAKLQKMGLWNAENPVPPWLWRRRSVA